MTEENTIHKAERELESGRPWRAKEILGSSIRTYGNSAPILKAYADTLNQLGDSMEAGKYYLLSVHTPSNIELVAIQLFLDRHKKMTYHQLINTFPRRLRAGKREDYPKFLNRHLEKMGAPSQLDSGPVQYPAPSRNQERMILVGCSLFAFAILFCLAVGLIEIISWLWQS